MMNASGKIRVFINGQDYSDFLVDGSVSDDSAYSTSIITTSGTLKLAGSADILDFNKTKFPIGSHVSIYVTLSNGKIAKMPRGSLLVLESSIDIKEPSITLELGCSLNYLSAREANYLSEIEDLIDTFIPQHIKNSFVIEQKDIATLNNLLDISGLIIFQNAYGTIQKAKKFGNDGIGSAVDSAKLVSFDKFTTIDVESLGGAIEELPSAVVVEGSTEFKFSYLSDDDEDDDPTNGLPPPFITSSTTRKIKIPDAEAFDPFFEVRNLPQNAEAQSEAIPSCGSISDPESNPTSYGYTVTGVVFAVEREVQETVTQGSYTSYQGPGNQVDFEYDFEHCSAGTYANSVLNGLLNKYVDAVNAEKQEAQAMCGKANQAFTQRDDFNSRPKTVVYFYEEDPNTGERTLVDQELSEESELNANAAEYYACVGQHYLDAAKGIAGGAEALGRNAKIIVDDYLKDYGYSSFNITYYFYNNAGSVSQKITQNYIHPAATNAAQKAINGIAYNRVNSSTGGFGDGLEYYYATGDFNYLSFRAVDGKSFEATVDGDTLITSHTISNKDPGTYFNLFLAQTTTTTYNYTNLFVEEVVEFVDHENPINSYKRTNFSSTGSKNPEEPDRIEIKRDADGNVYSKTRNDETKTIELKYRQAVKLTGTPTNVQSSWLGRPSPQEKIMNLPMDFAPIIPKYDRDGSVLSFNPTEQISRYEKILEKYAKNEAKKIAADNSGFRITEAGTRAELFGYYPFYPINLNLSSLGKRYGLRAASSNWVFDRDNILCSFDCFRTSEITSSVDQDEISPYIYTTIIKVEGVATIAPETINVASTATNITIGSLPQSGSLTLSGSPVAVGDTISISDLQAGNVVFTPLTNETTQVSFSYEVLDGNGNQIGSGDNIYPVDQYEFLENVFADGGEFTDNTTNGGVSAGGGDFDLGTRPGGNYNLNAGDFDTGEEVQVSEPLPSGIGNQQNGEANVEDDYGSTVVDQDGNVIGTDELPGPGGDNQGLLQIEIDFQFKTFGILSITSEIILQLGWDYGFITVSQGTPIDNGTITTPIDYNLNFGTITAPIEPALASSVS